MAISKKLEHIITKALNNIKVAIKEEANKNNTKIIYHAANEPESGGTVRHDNWMERQDKLDEQQEELVEISNELQDFEMFLESYYKED